jgi:hypothetical protein
MIILSITHMDSAVTCNALLNDYCIIHRKLKTQHISDINEDMACFCGYRTSFKGTAKHLQSVSHCETPIS